MKWFKLKPDVKPDKVSTKATANYPGTDKLFDGGKVDKISASANSHTPKAKSPATDKTLDLTLSSKAAENQQSVHTLDPRS